MALNTQKKWVYGPTEELKESDEIPSFILSILAQIDIKDSEAVDAFLNPSLHHLPEPGPMADLAKAIDILEKAVYEKNCIVVYGDYDADGVTATALLISFFDEIGISCSHYIPKRLSDGYGLNLTVLRKLRDEIDRSQYAEPVIITVDCGISAFEEITEAEKLGFKVIVTDHHIPPRKLPTAEAIINPHRKDCRFPDKDLSGVGVAFYLLIALRARLTETGYWETSAEPPNLKKYLDLVAIGTIADQVPLTGANRVLVKAGLEVIQNNPRPGLESILEKIGAKAGVVNAGLVAYQIAPRINAAGRVADAELALKALTARTKEEADILADLLEKENNRRKELSERIFNEACLKAKEQLKEGRKSLVIFDKDWHIGVTGLIASRIAELFWRPTVIISFDDNGIAKGSGRSIDGVDLYEAIHQCSDCLEKFGGHRAAAGITVKLGELQKFTEKFETAVNRIIKVKDLQPVIYVNLRASINELIEEKFLDYFEKMEPFGNGNPEPIFCNDPLEPVSLKNLRKIGRDSIRFTIEDNWTKINGVGFGMAGMLPVIEKRPVDIAYKLVKNHFRGVSNWEIRVEDIKPTGNTVGK